MQEQVVLAQRLAVVGHIQQGGVVARALRLQEADRVGQHVVGVGDRVVVGIDDCVRRALAQLGGVAGWRVALEFLGRAPVVGRAVAAHLVQHDQVVALAIGHLGLQPLQQDLVHAFGAAAQRGVGRVGHLLRRQPGAHALAAGLVVAPLHAEAGAVHHMQQRLFTADALLVVVASADAREHAGQRGFGVGAAAAHIGEIDDIERGQFGRGLPRVAVQPPVHRAGGFADDQHKEQRLAAPGPGRAGHRIDADGHQRLGRLDRVGRGDAGQRIHIVGRGHQVAHRFVRPHQRRQVLRHRHERADADQHRGHERAQAPGDRHPPRPLAHLREPHQPGRQHSLPGQVRQHVPGQQVTRFADIGVHQVAQHRRVEEHRVPAHEVGREGGAHQQQDQHWLGGAAGDDEAQQEEVHHHQQHEHADAEAPGARVAGRSIGERAGPERAVAHRHEIHADPQRQRFRRQRPGLARALWRAG